MTNGASGFWQDQTFLKQISPSDKDNERPSRKGRPSSSNTEFILLQVRLTISQSSRASTSDVYPDTILQMFLPNISWLSSNRFSYLYTPCVIPRSTQSDFVFPCKISSVTTFKNRNFWGWRDGSIVRVLDAFPEVLSSISSNHLAAYYHIHQVWCPLLASRHTCS